MTTPKKRKSKKKKPVALPEWVDPATDKTKGYKKRRADAEKAARRAARTPEQQASIDARTKQARAARLKKREALLDGYDLSGFYEVARGLKIKKKQGGVAVLGDVIRPNQNRVLDFIKAKRASQSIMRTFEVKCRQFASMSTITTGAVWADALVNPGVDAVITAHKKSSLMNLSQLFRYFTGRTRKAGRAERVSDFLFETNEGSRASLELAGGDLGRSGSITHLVVSEADYIQDFRETWRSVQPSLSTAFWSMAIMETTLRRGVSGQFREILQAAHKGEYPPWEVNFTAWHDVPELSLTLTKATRQHLESTLDDYERELYKRHELSLEQVAWYRTTRIGGMFGSYDGMKEAYPTTFDEAMALGFGSEFFRPDAIRWYEDNVRDPIARYRVDYDGIRDLDGEAMGQPHLEVWEGPSGGAEYVIGADTADAEKRISVEGSENYAVVTKKYTGEIVAQWHGYASAYDFAATLAKIGERYNEALIVPEVNYSGGSVIDALRKLLHYSNVYQRESMGKTMETYTGVYGFDTRGQSRDVLVGRIQRGINDRLFTIPSRYLLDQIKDFGRRGGVAAKRRGRGTIPPDDGVIAMGLTTFGHRFMVDNGWRTKERLAPVLMVEAPKRMPGGIRIERERDRGPVWDSTWNCWR